MLPFAVNPQSVLLSTLFDENLYAIPYLNPVKEILLEGGNAKNILIWVIKEPLQEISDTELSLLFKILKSIHLELPDIHLLKTEDNFPYSLERIIKIYAPKVLLCFGARKELKEISEKWTLFNPYTMGNTEFILASSLALLNADVDKSLKNKLWSALKSLDLGNRL